MATIGLELLYHVASKDFRSRQDAVVCCVHWLMVRNGFVCVGTNQDLPQDQDQDQRGSEILPPNWNESQDAYNLQYLDRQTSGSSGSSGSGSSGTMVFLKIVQVEGQLMVNAVNSSNERTASAMLSVDDYVTEDLQNFSSTYKNVGELVNKFQKDIFQVLTGTAGTTTSGGAGGRNQNDAARNARRDERSPQPFSPFPNATTRLPPLGAEDDDPLRSGPIRYPQQAGMSAWYDDPLSVGRGDLDPFSGPGGGMLMDPRRPPAPGSFDPSAGLPNRLPPGSIPPGARFDPFAPPDQDMPGRAPRNMGPDPDHMKPPGFDDMFS